MKKPKSDSVWDHYRGSYLLQALASKAAREAAEDRQDNYVEFYNEAPAYSYDPEAEAELREWDALWPNGYGNPGGGGEQWLA